MADDIFESASKPKRSFPKIPRFLISYFLFLLLSMMSLQGQVNTMPSAADEPFLTHLHLSGDNVGSGVDPMTGTCAQKTSYTLSKLTEKINEDFRQNAMVPLNITIGDTTVTMPGLHLNSFRDKRIAMLGDSTLFYLSKFLISMMIHEDQQPNPVDYHKMTSDEAAGFLKRTAQFNLKGTAKPPPYKRADGTWFQWWGMQGNAHGRTEELIDDMFQSGEEMRPEVVVTNMAFHWFHLCGYSEKMCPNELDSPIMSRWKHYRETWLQRVYDFALKVKPKVLLIKTANLICGSKRTGDWLKGDVLYQSFDNATIAACTERLYPLAKPLFFTREDTEYYCKYGQFTDVGSQHLNKQIIEFVNNIQQNIANADSGVIVGLYNDYDIERCETTDDAIHHKRGVPMRLRLLANTIESYLKCAT